MSSEGHGEAQTAGTGDADTDTTGIGYADAMVELEQILRELEGDTVDVDHLAERVQRASVLIRLCRDRIGAARLHIEQVVADLD
jgi:exodeoxyribonuclease VII small subunit